MKRPLEFIDLTEPEVIDLTGDDSDQNETSHTKKPRLQNPQEVNHLYSTASEDEIGPPQPVVMTADQEAVVKLAMGGHNLFITGAAGCGKTVTLKAIVQNFGDEDVQVIAPTGIAALPLGGKTTFSFMGWNPNSLKKPINELRRFNESVQKRIQPLKVIIIEEVSMVENQFLERMDLVLQEILGNDKPFGGKQVLIFGDFHQLPPVKPFQFCIDCGESLSKFPPIICSSNKCSSLDRPLRYDHGDKWAFRATAWKALNLKNIQLLQIHRQRDALLREILQKVRYGTRLNPEEWRELERKKYTPPGMCAVRLMSLRRDVDLVNVNELYKIKAPEQTWECLDQYRRLFADNYHTLWETEQPLKDHRLQQFLVLKQGAKVVLLTNLDPKMGLVNGSQGEIVDFQKRKPVAKEHSLIPEFFRGEQHTHLVPIVRFANGETRAISPIVSEAQCGSRLRGTAYLATRVQVPLMLGWALSIHKSQGMTLEYVQVSSKDLFQAGQLYVGLSRATHLEGLTVTGFTREQLEVDSDVLEFYENAEWEDISKQ